MLIGNDSNPLVADCIFEANTGSDFGGGLYTGMCSPTVTDCALSDNSAILGSGMYNYESSPSVTNCTFSGNSANESGGGMYNQFSGPTVANCTFSGNSANESGGGMFNNDNSSPTVTDCTFADNSAYFDGGGMCSLNNSSPTVADSTSCGNTPDPIYGLVVLGENNDMSPFCPMPVCPSDTNGDGMVNVVDFLAMLANWGACP
jgi:parallel beta-helix repeat protein